MTVGEQIIPEIFIKINAMTNLSEKDAYLANLQSSALYLFIHLLKTLKQQLWSYLPNPSSRAGYDTRSIFKRSLTGLNSEFSFS